MRLTILTRVLISAAAMALALGSLVALSPYALAHPVLPPCSQWGFPGNFSLYQSTGDTVSFNATGRTFNGLVPVRASNADRTMYGTGGTDSGITGNHVEFDVLWTLGPPASNGHYLGKVANDGYAHGSTYDTYDPDPRHVAHWDSQVPFVCLTLAG